MSASDYFARPYPAQYHGQVYTTTSTTTTSTSTTSTSTTTTSTSTTTTSTSTTATTLYFKPEIDDVLAVQGKVGEIVPHTQ